MCEQFLGCSQGAGQGGGSGGFPCKVEVLLLLGSVSGGGRPLEMCPWACG